MPTLGAGRPAHDPAADARRPVPRRHRTVRLQGVGKGWSSVSVTPCLTHVIQALLHSLLLSCAEDRNSITSKCCAGCH